MYTDYIWKKGIQPLINLFKQSALVCLSQYLQIIESKYYEFHNVDLQAFLQVPFCLTSIFSAVFGSIKPLKAPHNNLKPLPALTMNILCKICKSTLIRWITEKTYYVEKRSILNYLRIIISIYFINMKYNLTGQFADFHPVLHCQMSSPRNWKWYMYYHQNNQQHTTPFTSSIVVMVSTCFFDATEHAGYFSAKSLSSDWTWYFKNLSTVVTFKSLVGSTFPSISM